MKKIIFGFVGVVGLILLIIGFISKQSQIKSENIQDVTVIDAVAQQYNNNDNFGALVGNSNEAVLSAQIGGNINSIFVKEGDRVKKGQILASISSPELVAQYNGTQTQLQIAQEEEKKARRKWDDFKPEEREQFKLQVDGARSASSQAAAMLSKSKIVAPFDGIISQTFVKSGDTIMLGGQVVYIIGANGQKEISVSVPVTIGSMINIGDGVNVVNNEKKYNAKIIAISPVTNSATRKNLVKIALTENDDIALGSFVNVEFNTDGGEGVSVPKEAIVKQYNDSFVFVVDADNISHMKDIKIVGHDKDNVIVDGINDGDNVIVSGAHFVQEGDIVNIVK